MSGRVHTTPIFIPRGGPAQPIRMYNGLGLRTARGSGTNGYVQRNLSFAKPRTQGNYQPDLAPPKPARKPNADVMLHRSKRQIEVECLQYEEELAESQR